MSGVQFVYSSSFDAEEALRRHAVPNPRPRPGHLVNFLDVATDITFFPSILDGRGGDVEGIPIPANWHADVAEWAAALRSVDLAGASFTAIELGCGWGCWLNNMGSAARRLGKKVHLIGVEGDEGHLGFARDAFATNGFHPSETTLYRGIAAARQGVALFPRQARSGVHWGLEPVFYAGNVQRLKALATRSHDEIPMVPLSQLAAGHDRIDLLHIDIQGGEADFIAGCLDDMTRTVAYVVIGTHSRQIEGKILDTMLGADWALEVERAAIVEVLDGRPDLRIDGVQGWRNRHLSAI
jgi:FkbM family methyltransferase